MTNNFEHYIIAIGVAGAELVPHISTRVQEAVVGQRLQGNIIYTMPDDNWIIIQHGIF
jgi:hypothetical protein